MSISILQWNIWYTESVRNITSFLLRNKADIICLQELMYDFSDQEVANMTNHLAKSLGYNYYDKAIKTEGETWRQANGIFTHFPIIKQRAVWINEPIGNRKGYDNEHRAYVETVLDVQGTLLTVATTHMSYTDRFESTKRKKQKVNRLVKLIKAKRKNYLLTGGFNSHIQLGAFLKTYKILVPITRKILGQPNHFLTPDSARTIYLGVSTTYFQQRT
jgi:endonuclease/exonuclease/phosphatase family metal-dependent hydrolase